jgi:hypothetical protein
VAVGDDVCVGDFVKFCTLTCTPPPLPDDSPITNEHIVCVRSTVGQVLGYFEEGEGDFCCTINLHIKQNQVPRCVKVPGVSTVPSRILLAQTNMKVYITVMQVKAVALVIHHHKFKEQHNGFLNVYTVDPWDQRGNRRPCGL